jgi:septal ring factor EnvC (AmiA/AmiB activator)
MVNFFVTKKISNTSKAAKWVSIFAVFVFAVSSLQLPTVFAQTTGNAQLGLAQSERAALEDQLAQLEAEIAQKQQELKGQQGQSQTLSNDIAVLKTKINKAKLDIKAKNIVITQLGGEITDKSNEIQSLSDKIDNEKESLAQLIRNTNNMDQSTIIDLMLTQNSISSFYNDVAAYDSIKSGIKQSVDQILKQQNNF